MARYEGIISASFLPVCILFLLSINTEMSVQGSLIKNLLRTNENENYKIAYKTVQNIIERRDKHLSINCPLTIIQNAQLKNAYSRGAEEYDLQSSRPVTMVTVEGAEGSHRRYIEVNKYSQSEEFSNNFEFRRLSSNCEYMALLGTQAESMINLKTIIQLSNKNHYYFILEKFSEIKEILQHDFIQKLKFRIGIPVEMQSMNQVVIEKDENVLKVQSVDTNWIFEGLKVRNHNINQPFKFKVFEIPPHYVKTTKGEVIGDSVLSLAAAAHAYNFSYTLTGVPLSITKGPNGSWTGIIGDLIQGKVDGHFYIVPDIGKNPFMELASYSTSIELTFYTGQPRVLFNWRALQTPFQNSLWALILGLVVVLCLVVTAYFVIGQASSVSQPLSRAALITLAPLLSQSQNVKKGGGIQFLLIMWFFVSFVIQNYYNSNLLSHFTVPLTDAVPQDFEELSKRTDFKTFLHNLPGAPCDQFFQRTGDPIFTNLRDRFTKTFNPFSCLYPQHYPPEGAASDKSYDNSTAKTACIGWKHIVGQVIAQNFTQTGGFSPFLSSLTNAVTVFLNVGFPKQSKIKEEFDWIFQLLRDTGHFLKWTKEVFTYNQNIGTSWKKSQSKSMEFNEKMPQGLISEEDKFTQDEGTHKPFKLRYLLVAFGLLFFGSILGLVSYFLEKFIFYLRSK